MPRARETRHRTSQVKKTLEFLALAPNKSYEQRHYFILFLDAHIIYVKRNLALEKELEKLRALSRRRLKLEDKAIKTSKSGGAARDS